MKKYDTLFILDEFLDTGEFKSDYWHEIDGKSVLSYIKDRLSGMKRVDDIWICSSNEDQRAKEFAKNNNLNFYPFSENRIDTIKDWSKEMKNNNLFIFFGYSPIFDKNSINSAFEAYETDKYDISSAHDYPATNLISNKKSIESLYSRFFSIPNIFSVLKEKIRKLPDFSYKPFLNDEIFSPFYGNDSLPEHLKLNHFRFSPWYFSWMGKNHDLKCINIPFDPKSYHSKIQIFFLKDSDKLESLLNNSENFSDVFNIVSSISIDSPEKNKIDALINEAELFTRCQKWLLKYYNAGIDILFNVFDDYAYETILNQRKEAVFYIHANKICMKKKYDSIFSNRSIKGIILKYHDNDEWIKDTADFLQKRKIFFKSIQKQEDWNPKIGILFDIQELGLNRFDELSKRWDFRRVILEKYHRNLEPQNYWKIFYAQDVAYPEHIILKNKEIKYFQKRFPCKHIEKAFINEKSEFYLCPKQKDNIIGKFDGQDSFINAMKSPEKVKYIKANFNLELKGLECENCNLWYDPF